MSAALTEDEIDIIAEAAYSADMGIRDFPRWPNDGHTVAVVGWEGDFQKFMRELGQLTAHDDQQELMEKLGDWTCEGVALSTVWYWRSAEVEGKAHERLAYHEERSEQ